MENVNNITLNNLNLNQIKGGIQVSESQEIKI